MALHDKYVFVGTDKNLFISVLNIYIITIQLALYLLDMDIFKPIPKDSCYEKPIISDILFYRDLLFCFDMKIMLHKN